MSERLARLKLFYKILSVAVFAILIARFGQLQIYDWDKYLRESERNRIREVLLEPQRGIFYARDGEILVDNRPAYSISVIPYELLRADNSIALLSSLLDQPMSQIKQKVQKQKIGNFTPVKIRRQIDFKTLSALEEHRLDLAGVFHNIEPKRFYPGGIRAPHIFGYLGEITSQELVRWKEYGYKLGDVVGKKGLELQYERLLRGKVGVKYVEVDALGREVRDLPELSGRLPEPGANIFLTIDADIQRYLEKVMNDKRGAAVVLDSRNGEILAIMSKPDYEPELFSRPITPEVWKEVVNHEGKPLYNRASQSVYPPGSTFKLVLAAAALETGFVHVQQKVFCGGTYRLGTRNFDCWKKNGHGEVDFLKAIEQSCNVYFYTKGLEVGLESWSNFAKAFQFGKATGIDLPNESAGLVPDREYFDKKYGKKGWTKGLMLNLAVGQGDLLTTPLQMAYLAMILGNEGWAFRPHLLRRAVNKTTGEIVEGQIDSMRVQGISNSTFEIIKRGMYLVVNGSGGTAKASRLPNVEVCGKTGTAQNPHGNAHAWFIGFAPKENPEIAFCVLVENGGSGGAVAAPIARGILSRYFSKQKHAQERSLSEHD